MYKMMNFIVTFSWMHITNACLEDAILHQAFQDASDPSNLLPPLL